MEGVGRTRDVLGYIERRDATGAGSTTRGTGRPEGFRHLIAERVAESWRTIPHFTVTRDLDVDPLAETLADLRRGGGAVSVTDLLLRGLALSVADRGDAARFVGLAVATDRGVVIPVIPEVAELRVAALAEERRHAVERARSGKLVPTDLDIVPLTTLSNLGPFGVDSFTGVIPLGQTVMLTVGRIRNAVVTDGRTISIGRRMFATFNLDHRALDGADGAQILANFTAILLDRQLLRGAGGGSDV